MKTADGPYRNVPYWLDTAPSGPDLPMAELPDLVDVAIIGGGFTGMSAAVQLAKDGATVALFEQSRLGHGASGRNGGMATTGVASSFTEVLQRHGPVVARRLHCSYNRAIDFLEDLVVRESIDCDFERAGKVSLACKPSHYRHYEAEHAALLQHADYETRLVARSEIHSEIGSDHFVGALVDPLAAGLHVGKLAMGLATLAQRLGAQLFEQTAVTRVRREQPGVQRLETSRGAVRASHVLVATNGYTGAAVPYFRRRVVPVGSFVIVTEPLPSATADELMPTRRMASDSRNLVRYFRITPDNRLLFGGRAQFALSGPKADIKSAAILKREMVTVFPQLKDAKIEYAWGGLVAITMDRMPHAGERNGLHYSMGYSGHGVPMAVYMGRQMADVIQGKPADNPWVDLSFPAVPLHFGPPWFLPLADVYYRLKDRLA